MILQLHEKQCRHLLVDTLREKDKVPGFTLPNAEGKTVHFEEMFAGSKLVMTFYGGSWCPYCTLELLAWQATYEQLEKHNIKFVAISPQKPEPPSVTKRDISLTFEILIDVDNKVAKQFGLMLKVPGPEMRRLHEPFCIDLVSLNSDEGIELPIPATYIVDKDGTILKVFFGFDNHKQANLKEILSCLR